MLSDLNLVNKFLLVIGNSLLISFLVINIFNFLPFNVSSFIWLQNCSLLIVDTGSFILLGLSALFFVNKVRLKSISNQLNNILERTNKTLDQIINNEQSEIRKDLIKAKTAENIYLRKKKYLRKLSWSSITMFLLIIPIQFFILFKGISFYDINYSNNLNNINNQFETFVEKNNIKDLDLQKMNKLNLTKALKSKKNNQRFILFKNSLRVIIMSIIWLLAIFKIMNL